MAADVYAGPIYKALKRAYPRTAKFTLLEDNDPTGYKSTIAIKMKKKLGMHPIEFPPYSPDLNPLDFSIWAAIAARMDAKQPPQESVAAYKLRLRRTALALPESVVKKAVMDIPVRAALVVKEQGGHIDKD